jgi:hypothetical protein
MSLNLFLVELMEYIFKNCCNCTDKECIITIMEKYLPQYYNNIKTNYTNTDLSKCSQINKKEYIFENKQGFNICIYILEKCFKYRLLRLKHNKIFLLNSYVKLSWKNIKNINIQMCENYINQYENYSLDLYNYFTMTETQDINKIDKELFVKIVKILFWYIRKSIIDTLVGTIIYNNNYDLNALSVGSTNLESDYDITLYGNYNEVHKTINEFKIVFEQLFNTKSSYIFDTNLYGVSFIKKDDANSEYSCNNFNFTPTKNQIEIKHKITQHIWALIKFVNSLHFIKESNELLYEMLSNTLITRLNKNKIKLIQTAEDFISIFEANTANYDKIIKYLATIDNEEINNFISFINYNGQETYFTRGAFIDIVVNNQMCKNEIVKLQESEIIDSFIENVSDLMVHYNKTKYVERIKKTTIRLPLLDLDLIKRLEKLQQKCKDTTSIEECEIHKFLKLCILIIIDCLEKYINFSNDEIKIGIDCFIEMSKKFPSFKELNEQSLSKTFNKSSMFNNMDNDSILKQLESPEYITSSLKHLF